MIRSFIVFPILVYSLVLSSCSNINKATLSSQKVSTVEDYKRIGNMPIQFHPGKYIGYDSAEDLSNRADLVIIGSPLSKFEDSQPIRVKDTEQSKQKIEPNQSIVVIDSTYNSIVSEYTVTPVKIKKVIKGSITENIVNVIQAAAVVQEEGKSSYITAAEGFTPLEKNGKYLLFLKQLDSQTFPNMANFFSIMSVNQGKFNLDKTDSREDQYESKDSQYKSLKLKILKKFLKETQETP
jgi:hypothetical protein